MRALSVVAAVGVVVVSACGRGAEAPERPGVAPAASESSPPSAGPTAPARPDADTLREIAGRYVLRFSPTVWWELVLEPDGRYTQSFGDRAALTRRGTFTLAAERLTLRCDPPGEAERYHVREHAGRKLLLGAGELDAFELLPSARLGYRRLRPGEARAAIDEALAPLENPADPEDPAVRLPSELTLTVVVDGPGGPEPNRVLLRPEPYGGAMTLAGRELPMGVSDWVRLTRAWRLMQRPGRRCPAPRRPDAPGAFSIAHAGGTVHGVLPPEPLDAGAAPADGCAAARQLAAWLRQRIRTMFPPSRSRP